MEALTTADTQHSLTMGAATKTFLLSRTVRDLLRSAPVSDENGNPTISVAGFVLAALERGDPTTAAAALQNIFDPQAIDALRQAAGTVRKNRNSTGAEMSAGLWQALSAAQDMRLKTGGNDQFVGLRYVLLAMVTAVSDPLAAETNAIFSATGGDRAAAALAVATFCIRYREQPENRDAWVQILRPLDLEAALEDWPADAEKLATASAAFTDAFPQPVPLLHPDDPWAQEVDDESGARLEARAFADMIVAEKFQPPLAVGVFGDWGAGKSYFLRLLHEEVADNRRRRRRDAGTGFTFCQRVVQIRFNAWHYAETNLWASLVDHIFTSLNQWTIATGTADEAKSLFEQLTTAQRLTIEAAATLAASRRARLDASARLAEAERVLQQKRAAMEDSPATFVRAAFQTLTAREDVKQQLSDAGQTLGFDAISENSTALVSATKSLDSELSRFALLGNGTVRSLASPIVFLAVAVGALVLPPVAAQIATFVAGEEAQLGASIGGFLAPVIAALGWATANANKAVDTVSKFRAQFEADIEQRVAADNAEKDARAAALAAAEARVADATESLRLATANAAEAALLYNSESGSERVLRFVRNKVANGEYAKHLSFVATARKDFEELSRLMTEAATPALDAEQARIAHMRRIEDLLAKDGDLLEPEEQNTLRATAKTPAEHEDKVFERIVLYMDDLDRCAPQQVIAVLQAIHLLLAFPLFVVFVAVDVRWLRQALATCYPGQINDDEGGDINASTSDYLEKIFQVPYWVHPFDGNMTRNILQSRISLSLGGFSAENDAPAGAALMQSVPPPKSAVASSQSLATGGVAQSSSASPMMQDIQPMSMTESERTCLIGMAASLDGLPRRTLRFLNTYWIIKGGLVRTEQQELEAGGYSALAALLAISIITEDGFPDLVSQIKALTLSGNNHGNVLPELKGADDAITTRIKSCLDAAGSPPLENLHHYAALVSRYSFHRGL